MTRFFTALFVMVLALSCTKVPTTIVVNPSEIEIPAYGGGVSVSVRSEGTWTMKIADGWCTASQNAGKGNSTVTFRAESNIGGDLRTTVATFYIGLTASSQVIISQSGEGTMPVEIVSPDPASGITVDPEVPNADQPCTIKFNPQAGNELYNHSGELYAHLGIVVEGEWMFVPCEWAVSEEKVHFKKVAENSWELKIEPSIREYFGSGDTPVNMMAIIVRSEDGEIKSHPNDQFVTVTDNRFQPEEFIPDEIVFESMPSGVKYGINYNPDNSVTLVLYDRDKNGACHDYCYVVGDWNSWERVTEGAMKRDKEAGCWWTTVTGLDASTEYRFQYRLGTPSGTDIRVSDPYTEIVYDQWNDQYLPGYESLPEGARALVSAFQINRPQFNWQHKDFQIDDKNDLIIYELLLRDFSETKDLAGAKAQLDYLQTLGINAIELMPIQEFDGNLSWGYNPNHYFALDKAYGTREQYKEFIDECHARGIAVIIDVVFNHMTGSSPWAKMYWDSGANCTAENNPWFNVAATHPFSVFHDLNHENLMVRDFVKESLEYLLTEYDVDGFRFDLSKGLTQKNSGDNVSSWSSYDASRIAILKDYWQHVQKVNPNAVMILEHFADGGEEKELANAGMQLWRNCNGAYKTVMGGSKSDFGSVYSNQPFGGFVSYMESHDEERICYGVTGGSQSVSWGICGTFTNWGTSPDIALTADGAFYSSKSVEFAANDMFKIRGNSEWNDAYNYGASSKGYKLPLDKEYSLTLGSSSQDMAVPAAGKYDLYFSPDAGKVWLMTVGKRPADPQVEDKGDALEAAMRRAGCCAAFFLTVPGPKMIWQFGEIGYDISGGNGDTSEKPVKTQEYLANQARKGLYDTYSALLKFRKENPRFFDSDASFSWNATGWDNGRTITCTADGKSFAVVGNFTTATKNITVTLPSDGQWKDYEAFGSQTYDVPSDKKLTLSLKPAEFRLIVK